MHQEKINYLKALLSKVTQEDYCQESRIHSLHGYEGDVYLKRDDELGFGVSGSKLRKYRTLIPYCIENGIKVALIVGSCFSNHVLGITQLLIEKGIKPILFLKKNHNQELKGNYFYLYLMRKGYELIWVDKDRWKDIDVILNEHHLNIPNSLIIPEGAALFPSFLGALSLPLDVLRNELQSRLFFDSFFLDWGTGYTAAAFVLFFSFIERHTRIHILSVADNEAICHQTLSRLHKEFQLWLGVDVPYPQNVIFSRPNVGKSFGATHPLLFDEIVNIASEQGVFFDPIYSIKLFDLFKKKKEEEILGKSLIIHSGGGLSLTGFQDRFI